VEESLYLAYDEQMDLYKYVDDIKYNFDYSKSNIMRTRTFYRKDFVDQMKAKIEAKYGVETERSKEWM
jgi:hypothetical protein